jgi:hypothetical protein
VSPVTDVDRDAIVAALLTPKIVGSERDQLDLYRRVLFEVVARGGAAGMWCEARNTVGKVETNRAGNGPPTAQRRLDSEQPPQLHNRVT